MYNTGKMIETGRQAIRRNPNRDATSAELFRDIPGMTPDKYEQLENAFLFGVAVGMRIAGAEAKDRQEGKA